MDKTSANVADSNAARPPLEERARRFGMQAVPDPLSLPASAEFVEKVPIRFARRHGILGLAADAGPMPVAIGGLEALESLETVCRFLGRSAVAVLAPPERIVRAINAAYQKRSGQAENLIRKLVVDEGGPAGLDRDSVLAEVRGLAGREDLLDVASRAPVIKLVNLVLFEAVKLQASDVHIQPYEERLVVRLRIDGVLFDAFDVPKSLQDEVVSRVKVMGRMDIAEKRLPQDGRATAQVGDRVIDLRIATLPTRFGERAVIRLLDKSANLYSLGEVGMDPATVTRFRQLIRVEHGIVLVTGPTGSGKTTTLYAALREIDSTRRNVLTLEDPIEYGLDGVSQTQVSDKKGMTFAGGLRSVLRQDPDVIMVGEIRDRETATMAIQSALTGHLVFSTLHTNDAPSAVTRLLDLGVEPYLLASSIIGVLAQRLVRKVCGECGAATEASTDQSLSLGLPPMAAHEMSGLRQGQGCDVCRQTGYRGRVGIFELMAVESSVRRLIMKRSSAAKIASASVRNGMRTLRQDGVAKVLSGITTCDEVLRVTSGAAEDDVEDDV